MERRSSFGTLILVILKAELSKTPSTSTIVSPMSPTPTPISRSPTRRPTGRPMLPSAMEPSTFSPTGVSLSSLSLSAPTFLPTRLLAVMAYATAPGTAAARGRLVRHRPQHLLASLHTPPRLGILAPLSRTSSTFKREPFLPLTPSSTATTSGLILPSAFLTVLISLPRRLVPVQARARPLRRLHPASRPTSPSLTILATPSKTPLTLLRVLSRRPIRSLLATTSGRTRRSASLTGLTRLPRLPKGILDARRRPTATPPVRHGKFLSTVRAVSSSLIVPFQLVHRGQVRSSLWSSQATQ